MNLTRTTTACPECGQLTVRPESGPDWCPGCERGLGTYDPEFGPRHGWRLLDRLGHRLAFRLDRRLFRELAAGPPPRPGWTPARVVLTAISVLLALVTLGLLLLGVALIANPWHGWNLPFGVLYVVIAYVVRPRLGRLPAKKTRVSAEQAPVLHGLLHRVAAAAGAPVPDVVAVDLSYNAATGRVGLRQRQVLWLGAPLWATLPPQLRVALLGHELGHEVNGDPNRNLVIQPALATFARLASWTGIHRTVHDITFGESASPMRMIVQWPLWLVSRVFLLVQLGIWTLAGRDSQRAEYLADGVAVQVAGTEANVELSDRDCLADPLLRLLAYDADRKGPDRWRAAAESYTRGRAADLPLYRQLSRRASSIWDTHPPSGFRAAIAESWPHCEPAVVLTEEESAAIDRELAVFYAAAHRRLLGTREFRPVPATPPAALKRPARPARPAAGAPAGAAAGE